MKRLQTLALEQKEDARHGDATFPIWFRSTVFRQTKVYLLALDSIFVPSVYSTFRLLNPLEERRSTVWAVCCTHLIFY